MKRLILGLCATAILAFGPLPTAHAWWWHHSKSKPAGAEKSSGHHEKSHMDKPVALYASPRSVGFWHKSPGPMGAGSGVKEGTAQTAANPNSSQSNSAQAPHHHKLFGWFHHHDTDAAAPAPATAGAPATPAPNSASTTN